MLKVKLESLKKQGNAMKESLRELRTNIRFCGDDIKTILFTSVMPNEGKSTVVMDLARSLVQAGNRVLVIDTDMRKSVLVGRYKVKREDGGTIYGLSHLLSGQRELVDVVYETQSSRLMAIFAGPAVVNPTELLENKYFTKLMTSVRKLFDYILVDCAPLGAAIDAAVVAKDCDGAIIVISQGEVSSRSVVNVKEQLEASGVRILGAVLNKVDMHRNSYYGRYYGKYYGRYYGKYYGKYYGNENEEIKLKRKEQYNEKTIDQNALKSASDEIFKENYDEADAADEEGAADNGR